MPPKPHQTASSQAPTAALEPPQVSSPKQSPGAQIGFVLLGPSYKAHLPTPSLPCLVGKKSADYTLQLMPRGVPFSLSLFLLQLNVEPLSLLLEPNHSTLVPGPCIQCQPTT